ncbi:MULTISPECIES: Zn-ribbon domain-containing OB-fold protein [Amycolatopsis]|uniref:Zn-ribbon domain-containing OB-fold protein n=1 Tax=Amycolatopsis albidoflavus TaxID=102226 RepID=A0ABW5HSN9_9PSEU
MGLNAALQVPTTAERPRDNGFALVGSRCGQCGAAAFPARAVCHRCGTAAPAEHTFAATGVLLTYTTVHVPRPGLPAPYTLGQIALDDGGPMVFGQVRTDGDEPEAGMAVQVRIGETPRYWFVPERFAG